MLIAYSLMLAVFFIAGIWLATKAGPYIQKTMDFIWVDPTVANRNKVSKRIKELCVDGDVPDETAVLLASRELNLTEQHVKDALDGITPQVMKAVAKGDYLSEIIRAGLKVSKKIKGA